MHEAPVPLGQRVSVGSPKVRNDLTCQYPSLRPQVQNGMGRGYPGSRGRNLVCWALEGIADQRGVARSTRSLSGVMPG